MSLTLMNWTDVSIINCLFSLSLGLLIGVVNDVDAGDDTIGLSAPMLSLPPGLEPDGVTLTAGLAAVRRLLAEKARWSRAAVVDRFRIRPFIFWIVEK